ncbi:hypothetical protein L9F63_012647 [Diploptera punctata]|uniref:Uncharacterized protein n=1 Tax=Diploptera punctata TaxID=6984 RepID=A0AAD8AC86_DIPPU|nr:hypothetical protein L9F63_012647 [Diploptera punctata]
MMDCGKVSRIVIPSEYEHKDRQLKEKWEAIFKQYEFKEKPKHRRASVVSKILSQETFVRVASITQIELSKLRRDDVLETKDDSKPLTSSDVEIPSPEEEDKYGDLDSDLFVNLPSSREEKTKIVEDNPYLNFFKKSTKQAATWRPKDEFVIPTGTGIKGAKDLLKDPHRNLKEKANNVTNSIIKDFCDWFRGLGGLHHPTVTEGVLQQLFEIGFDAPAAKALCVRSEELPVVTEDVAKARNLPECAVRAGLQRIIREDIQAESNKPRVIGFGRTLRPPLRYEPPHNNTKEKWVDCPNIRQDLVTHKVAFDGITDLRSTRSFCEYLEKNPHIRPPQYLQQMGMIPK